MGNPGRRSLAIALACRLLSGAVEVGYGVAFLGGLAGSMHCIGMCGGFPLALASAQRNGLARQLAYNAGRLNALAFFGAVAGMLGATWLAAGPLQMMERVLSLVCGALMVMVGLEMLGLVPEITTAWGRRLHGTLVGLLKGPLQSRSVAAPLALGVLNAFLPCQLIYAAAASAAATASVVHGALLMLAFGFGTVPAMLSLGLVGQPLRARWGETLRPVAAVVFALFGVVTVARGALPGHAHSHCPAVVTPQG